MGDKEKHLSESQIRKFIPPILKFFYGGYFQTFQHQDAGYQIFYSKIEFYEFLIRAVCKHGPDATHILCQLLDEEWNNPDNEKYWSAAIWGRILNTLYFGSVEKEWCKEKLCLLQKTILRRPSEYEDTYARIKEYSRQAVLWHNFRRDDLSNRCLSKMFQTSLSIDFHKDYQLNSWIEWLETINNIETRNRIERTLNYANLILVLKTYVERRADEYAAKDLIAVTFNWSPIRAFILTTWFLEKDILSNDTASYNYLLQVLKSSEDIEIEAVIPYIDIFLTYSDETEGVHKEIIRTTITRAFQKDDKIGRKITRHIIQSIEHSIFDKLESEWKLVVADILKDLGIDPKVFRLNYKKIENDLNSKNTNSIKIDDSIPEALLKFPISPEVLIENIPTLKYRNKWEPIILKHLKSYKKRDVNKLLSATTHNSDLTVLIAQRLFELNDLKNAQKACLKAINECPFGGYGFPLDYGTKVEALKIISKIDPEKAQDLFFEIVYLDLTLHYPYYSSVATRMHDIIPQLFDKNQIKEIWVEIQGYVSSLFSEYTIPNEIPKYFCETIKKDSPSIAFNQYQTFF